MNSQLNSAGQDANSSFGYNDAGSGVQGCSKNQPPAVVDPSKTHWIEILVKDKEIEALHARFRIAINFPDLSMMGDNSFMNIMPTPDAIKEALTKVAGGKASDF